MVNLYRKFLISMLLFVLSEAQADYRVYSLMISNKITGKERSVLTTLDPDQYPGYHPLRKDEAIAYQKSWMCWGRADYFQALCPDPTQNPSTTPVTSTKETTISNKATSEKTNSERAPASQP